MSMISVALAFGSVSRGPISQMKAILVLTEAVICLWSEDKGKSASFIPPEFSGDQPKRKDKEFFCYAERESLRCCH
jgi:hypothetical protein